MPTPQTTDGAAAVMLMRREEAARRGLPVMATLRSFAAVGVPPSVMGIGPAAAIPRALEKVHIGCLLAAPDLSLSVSSHKACKADPLSQLRSASSVPQGSDVIDMRAPNWCDCSPTNLSACPGYVLCRRASPRTT